MPALLTRASAPRARALEAHGAALAVVALLTMCVLAAMHPVRSATAASASATIGAEVLSATSLDVSGCASQSVGRTNFGPLTTTSSNVTTADCRVLFGSSNDTARLAINQTDRSGQALWQMTDGRLDQSFDGPSGTGNGIVTYPSPPGEDTSLWVLAVDDQGRTVGAGRRGTGATYEAFLTRALPDGTLDPTFDGPSGNGNGAFTVDVRPSVNAESIHGIAIDSQSRIVVTLQGLSELAIARFLPDGQLDLTFDGDATNPDYPGNGVVRRLAFGTTGIAEGLTMLPDDSMLIGIRTGSVNGAALVKIRSDGAVDSAFDGDPSDPTYPGNGEVRFGDVNDKTWDVRTDRQGRGVLVGTTNVGLGGQLLRRFDTATGLPDVTFDGPTGTGNGTVTIPLSPGPLNSWVQASFAPDGRIILAGWSVNAAYEQGLLALNDDGTVDTSFDGSPSDVVYPANGFIRTRIDPWYTLAQSGAVLPTGQILTAGYIYTGSYLPYVQARTASGALDTTFAGGGANLHSQGTITLVRTPELAVLDADVLTDGRVILGAYDYAADNNAVFIRLDSNTMPDYDGALAGWGTSMFGACLRATSATASWTVNASCTASNGAWWNAVTATPVTIARTTAAGTTNASADLRFGIRTAADQRVGQYVAPVTFSVTAPG